MKHLRIKYNRITVIMADLDSHVQRAFLFHRLLLQSHLQTLKKTIELGKYLGSNLVAALSGLNMNNFPHIGNVFYE